MRILGVDPGSIICGYGVIEKKGKDFTLVEYGVIKAKKNNAPLPLRLKEIYLRLTQVIDRTAPETAVFETIFYSKNAQSLMKLSHARGAAILSAAVRGLPVAEYSPREVKKSVTGRGGASKEQVRFMVKKLLNIETTPEFYDSTDALAAAMCHCIKSCALHSTSSSWSDFVKNNPDRVVRR